MLGVIEGVTEFLPISSTGHLLVASALLDFRSSLNSTFEIFIQLGAVLAVIFFYRAELAHQARTIRSDAAVRRLWLNVAIAFMPSGFVGFFLRDWIKANLVETSANAGIIAAALIAGGIVFLFVERSRSGKMDVASLSEITPIQALLVGVAQVTALIPGVSRSGASIIGGMIVGLGRETATTFSFYLAIPTLGIATAFELLNSLDRLDSTTLSLLIFGTSVSAVVAWLSTGWLLRYVSRNTLVPFGYYRIVAGLAILILIAMRVLPA
jgi:undecaprenyl-diphosphatase